jgi:hypothetical protein
MLSNHAVITDVVAMYALKHFSSKFVQKKPCGRVRVISPLARGHIEHGLPVIEKRSNENFQGPNVEIIMVAPLMASPPTVH